ncbi:WD40-repeat-containing domain protein [Lipomyces oligophaga]|uniref:WD40-repeat-containing domain protein n=1 Tax=Lipomyces oligophaga TaxID=45792 RepID=UPI0034CE1D14
MTSILSSRYVPLTCTGHSRPVTDLCFSSRFEDGSYYLISACKDGAPMLRDGVTGDWIGTFTGHQGATWSAAFSLDASHSVTASADFSAKVWETTTGKVLNTFPHKHVVRTAQFIPAQSAPPFVITAGHEKLIRIWDVASSTSNLVMAWQGSESTIKYSLWIDQSTVVTAGDDKTVTWWDLRTKNHKIESVILEGPISQLEVRNGIISIASGHSVSFFHAGNRRLMQKKAVSYGTSSASLHPFLKKFATGSSTDTWVRIHDLDSGELLDTLKGHHGPVHSLSYSPDGQILSTGGEDGTIRLWRSEPGPYGLWT